IRPPLRFGRGRAGRHREQGQGWNCKAGRRGCQAGQKEHREIICQHCQIRIPAQRGRRGRHQGVQGCTH
ncbi:hypothetical protein LIP76_19440, partial [Erysipelatoclostridium ramosum]|uniref:hypothetical protein n=1 Tax=Thomasclavelia ramosa TaxID=1547 RepID=UPI001D0046D9